MTTVFILILLIVAIGLATFRYIKLCMATLVVVFICFILIGNGLIPAILLDQLQYSFVSLPEPHWKNKNAIVLLGAGAVKLPIQNVVKPTVMAYARINEATQLYLSCIKSQNKCTIIISGGDALHTGMSEAVVYQEELRNLGINKADIKLETNSMNTYKNAELTNAILKKNQFDQVILVTSGIHLKRALLYFSHFGIEAIPARADYIASQHSIFPLGYNFAITDFAIHEYLGIARLYVYDFFGWNKTVSAIE